MSKSTSSAPIYTQEQLDAHLQAERVNMANSFVSCALNPLQTLAKLFITGPAEKEEWVDLNYLGDVLELAVLGAYMQTLRSALQEEVGYSSTPPYDYILEGVMSEWKDAQRKAGEFKKQAH